MKKNLLLTFALMFALFTLNAQTTILDFESPATSANFQYFGGSIDGTLSSVIANPDASGINTSANVTEFARTADGGAYGGGFTDPSTPIDLTTDNEICLKVWANEPTQLLLKLESGQNGAPNWELLQQITDTQTWVEVCYNVTGQAAGGQIYNRLTLFFDFESAPPADRTYYIDDVVTQVGTAAPPVDITFSVDMNEYAGSFTTVYVSGTMNDWAGDANPLADDDGDGVWTGTITELPVGGYEYKFTLDNWAEQEDFSGTFYSCTVTTGTNTNRALSASSTSSLPTVCYNSCYACGESVRLNINLGAGGALPSAEGFFIAGGGNFGEPGNFPLMDNGDGTHSGSFELPTGFSSFYTFTNGACGDYSCKEDIVGQDCSNPDNFDDRFMGPLNEDTTISTCFALCTDDTDCPVSVNDVTFSVDMNAYAGSFTTVYVSGTMNDWAGDANPLADDDGDGVWSGTITEMPTGTYEYKFTLDNWTVQEDFGGAYYDCTMTTGENTNRIVSISETTSLPTVCFESCYACGGAAMLTVHLGEGNATPSAEGFYIAGGGNFGVPGQFLLTDNNQDGIHSGRFEKALGFASFYTYTNGNCGDFSCKENIEGQDCADSGNYNDRFMGPLNENTTIADCFESCAIALGDGSNCIAALPIQLLAFTGRNVNGINELAWKTATEDNSDFFEIQKSTDGLNFVRIGAVDAAGTSLTTLSYTFEDATPAIGNNYYRLRMVDLDGASDYSNVVQIATRIIGDIAVYPVPVRGELFLVYDSENTGNIQIEVVNTVGQTLLTRTENTTQGLNTFELDTKPLAAGAYLIHVTDSDGLSKVKRFVKN